MPNRIIREGWLESDRINNLDAAAERFFLRLCLRADDYGRYHANPTLLRSNLFPLREDIRNTDIPRSLAACEKAGLLRCYEVDGKRFLEIERFNQRTRAQVSKFPSPPVNDGPMTDKCLTDDRPPRTETETETETSSEAYAKTETKTKTEPDIPSDGQVTAETIYAAYPRKVARREALKAITNAMAFAPPAKLLENTAAYAAAVSRWPADVQQYVPHPATWFNRGSYDDDPKTWERKTPPNGAHLEERFNKF